MSLLDNEDILVKRDPIYVLYEFHNGSLFPFDLKQFDKLSKYIPNYRIADQITEYIKKSQLEYDCYKINSYNWTKYAGLSFLSLLWSYTGDISEMEDFLNPYFETLDKKYRVKVKEFKTGRIIIQLMNLKTGKIQGSILNLIPKN